MADWRPPAAAQMAGKRVSASVRQGSGGINRGTHLESSAIRGRMEAAMKAWLDDACSLADAVRRGEVRAADALEASLEAIAASKLNAVCYLDADGARRRAEEIDRDVATGRDPGPFAGVPLLVKDLEDAAGLPTTHGSVVYKDNIAGDDAIDVSRLRAAGAIIAGKATR